MVKIKKMKSLSKEEHLLLTALLHRVTEIQTNDKAPKRELELFRSIYHKVSSSGTIIFKK